MFPKSNPELVSLLELLLQFNPYCRPSAKECLKLPLFDHIREEGVEVGAPYKMNITAETRPDLMIDYDQPLNDQQARFMINEYKRLSFVEVTRFQAKNSD